MNFMEKLGEDILETGVDSDGGLLERARKQTRDFFHRDVARKLACHCTADAVADGKDEVRVCGGRFADFAEEVDLLRVELQAKEGIFVVPASAATVRFPGPL